MAFSLVQGGLKVEPSIIKPEEENTVEICMDDILDSSDEENVPNTINQDIEGSTKNIPKPSSTNEIDSDEDENYGCEDFNAVDNLQMGEQLVLNFSENLNAGIHIKTNKSDNPEEVNWAEAYPTFQVTDIQEDIKKVVVTKAPYTEVEPHEYTTLASDKHICSHCQWVCKNLKGLKRHIRRRHREVTNIHQCPYCPFKSKWSLGSHIVSRHKHHKDIQWFKCHICDLKCKLKSQLANHCETHLNSEQMKTCPVCKKRFKKKSLRCHIRFVHNKEVKKKLQCEECVYATFLKKSMRMHVEEHHNKSRQLQTYKCTKCEFTTRYKNRLNVHMERHNLNFVCDICAYATSKCDKMKLHQMTHQKKIDERELKYRCDKCDYKTYRQYSLTVHLLNHLKPHEIQYFYCYHCDFKAKRKDNLKTHVLRHFKKEEIPFQCFICDFSTKKRQLLTKHIDKHATKIEDQTKASSIK